MDPPRHTEMRAVLSPHFRPGAVARLENEIRAIARDCLDEAMRVGRLDVAGELGARISSHMACRIVGFPLAHAKALSQRVNAFFHRRAGQRGETEKATEAAAALYRWVGDFVVELRAAPERATGVSADLLECRVEGRPLDDDDLVHAIVNLLIAASDTLPKALATTVDCLARAPDHRRSLVRDPSQIPAAFQEAVRFETPTQFQGRTVLEPIELGGRTLAVGERVCFLFASANRDPREFELPDRFDLGRRPPRTSRLRQRPASLPREAARPARSARRARGAAGSDSRVRAEARRGPFRPHRVRSRLAAISDRVRAGVRRRAP